MDDLTRMKLLGQLARDEGRRALAYQDSVGVWTIGVGHNLQERPLSDLAMDVILSDDLKDTERELLEAMPWAASLSPARFGVLVNMAFNLGVRGLLAFQKMLVALEAGQWERAADEMRDSLWAQQVGARATRLERQVITDQWA